MTEMVEVVIDSIRVSLMSQQRIDSRPSDALALAVRTHVPIMVTRSVMDTAGIIPEEDIQEEGEEMLEAPEVGSERLSVFEDFLENLKTEPDDDDDEGEDAE